jgi:hypothetical protein
MWQRWVERIRRRRADRIAVHARLWLEAVRLLLETCRATLQPQAMPPDLIPVLHWIDWRLEHILTSERAIKRTLRKQAPDLGTQLGMVTEHAFHLRNTMASYFIRWKAFQDARRTDEPTAFLDRREMEESLLAARRMADEVGVQLEAISPPLREAFHLPPQGPPAPPGDRGI